MRIVLVLIVIRHGCNGGGIARGHADRLGHVKVALGARVRAKVYHGIFEVA